MLCILKCKRAYAMFCYISYPVYVACTVNVVRWFRLLSALFVARVFLFFLLLLRILLLLLLLLLIRLFFSEQGVYKLFMVLSSRHTWNVYICFLCVLFHINEWVRAVIVERESYTLTHSHTCISKYLEKRFISNELLLRFFQTSLFCFSFVLVSFIVVEL